VVVQAFKFALDPTPRQARDLWQHAGAARVAYNWGLARVKANLSQRAAEQTSGLAGAELTPAVNWSLYGLRRDWNRAKDEVAPWWRECSKEAYNTGLEQLARGLKNWRDSKSGKRKGPPMGFPRFKSRRRSAPSVRFTTEPIRVEADRTHVTLPVLGTIKTHESTRKLERKIRAGTARILSATVRFERGRWFVAFTVEADRPQCTPCRPAAAVGVDLGVKHLAVLSDGTMIENPKHYEAARRKLACASRAVSRRRGPDRRTGQQPSNRWKKANATRNRVHHKVANQRADGLHKLTTALAGEYGTVVVEDLNVEGMKRNRKLARRICDAGFGEIRRQLSYKTCWRGGRLHVADRWYPSSKTCSRCATVKPKLSLRERTFRCQKCGLVLDRDLNAAYNLRDLVKQSTSPGVARRR
jgi:putative transposase